MGLDSPPPVHMRPPGPDPLPPPCGRHKWMAPSHFKRAVCISCRPCVDVHKGGGGPAHMDACGQGEWGQKRDIFVDVINGWPLVIAYISRLCTGRVLERVWPIYIYLYQSINQSIFVYSV